MQSRISKVRMHAGWPRLAPAQVWFARQFPVYRPNTLLLDNALATMGAGLPSALAAKLVHPDRAVLAVVGDGGFMMNSQVGLGALPKHAGWHCMRMPCMPQSPCHPCKLTLVANLETHRCMCTHIPKAFVPGVCSPTGMVRASDGCASCLPSKSLLLWVAGG